MVPDVGEPELLDTRPPRPGRRRRLVLSGLVVAAALGALVIARTGTDPSRPPARPSSPPPASSSGGSAAPASAGVVVNSADPAVSRLGDTVYALDEGTPITIDLNTGQRHEWSTSGIAPADAYRLLADGPAHRLWLVGATPAGTVVEFLDPTTMAVIGRHQAGGNFMDAAALSGRLYLATTTGVSTLPAAGEPVRPPALGGRPLLLAADPVRQRLLAVVLTGRSIRITAWLPGRDRPAVTSPSPIGKGNLVTAGGHVWVAGFGRRAVLAELDPVSLRVERRSRLAGELGAGALIVDAAARHLLVRAGAASGPVSDLWCVDAANGKVVRHWSPASGSAVLTDRGVDLLSPGRPLIRLPSGACRG